MQNKSANGELIFEEKKLTVTIYEICYIICDLKTMNFSIGVIAENIRSFTLTLDLATGRSIKANHCTKFITVYNIFF